MNSVSRGEVRGWVVEIEIEKRKRNKNWTIIPKKTHNVLNFLAQIQIVWNALSISLIFMQIKSKCKLQTKH
jgi:hypothetical protein